MGIRVSHSSEEWDDRSDWAAIREALADLAKSRGHFGPLEKWRHYDEYEALAIAYRILAKAKAEELGKPVWPIWQTYKQRLWQEIKGNVTTGLFDLSDHDRRLFRRAWAIAKAEHPLDPDKQVERATIIALNVDRARRRDAWAAYNYEQLSLFDVVHTEKDTPTSDRVTYLYEVIPDDTSTGADPADQYQQSFLDAVLEEKGLSDRAKLVAEMLSAGEDGKRSYQEIADILGVSKGTIANDVAKIREFGDGWLTDV